MAIMLSDGPIGFRAVSANSVYAAYARSLAWMAVLAASIVGAAILVAKSFQMIIEGHPGVPLVTAIELTLTWPLFFTVFVLIETLLVFTTSQCFQALVAGYLGSRCGKWANLANILALPITAVMTWYSFDYLVPSELPALHPPPSDADLGLPAYQHGLTTVRYLWALATQAPVTLFSIGYAITGEDRRARRSFWLLAFVTAVVAVVAFGLLNP